MEGQRLDVPGRVLVGGLEVLLLDDGREVLDRLGVGAVELDRPALALEVAVRDAGVVLEDVLAPVQDHVPEVGEVGVVEEIGTRLDERRDAGQAVEEPVERRALGHAGVADVAAEIIDAPRGGLSGAKVIDPDAVRPLGEPPLDGVRGFGPLPLPADGQAPERDDGVPGPLEEKEHHRQRPVDPALAEGLVHVLGHEVAALQEVGEDRLEVLEEAVPPLGRLLGEVGQVADRLEAHEDGPLRLRVEGEGSDKVRPAEGIEERLRHEPALAEVLAGPFLHRPEDGRIEGAPVLVRRLGERLPGGGRLDRLGLVGRPGETAHGRGRVVVETVDPDGERRGGGRRLRLGPRLRGRLGLVGLEALSGPSPGWQHRPEAQTRVMRMRQAFFIVASFTGSCLAASRYYPRF